MKKPSHALIVLWALAAILLGTGAILGALERESPREVIEGIGMAAVGLPMVEGAEAAAPSSATDIGLAQQEGQTLLSDQISEGLDTPLLPRLRSLLGMLLLVAIAWGLSVKRTQVPWRVIGWGIGLQLIFAVFILKTPVGAEIFAWLNTVVMALLDFTTEGARFIFGDLVFDNVPVGVGASGTNDLIQEVPGQVARTGASFAFNVLPTIIFFSSLMTVLYHVGIMQWVVKGVAWVMQKTLHTSGAETLSAAGNIFVGQTEAPLMIKPFIEKMTMSELHAVMTAGFATVAGGVMAAYVGMLRGVFPDIAGHLMAASVMSAPAALVMAKLMYPEDGDPATKGQLKLDLEKPDVNVIDAAARGAGEGLGLALNVGAMLLAFIALIALFNALLGWCGGLVGFESLSLQLLLGWILAPLAWFMGVPWVDAVTVGSLLGMKTVVNEFVAFLELSSILQDLGSLHPRSIVISIYALAGFANFSSIAIQLGGIGGLAPSRRHDLSRVGLRAMIAGSLAAFMTATIAGMLL